MRVEVAQDHIRSGSNIESLCSVAREFVAFEFIFLMLVSDSNS